MRLNIFDEYTYTLESIIQAGLKNMAIISVPVRINGDLRPSRLVKSIPNYIQRSILTIIRIFMAYRPFTFFTIPGVVSFSLGMLICLRFLFFYLTGNGTGHIQSLILAALLLGIGFFVLLVGLLADLISVNRKLLEKLNLKVQKIEDAQREYKKFKGKRSIANDNLKSFMAK
jgi:hypothetical protein